LYPFIAGHEEPLSGKQLSKRFAKETAALDILLAVYRRMKPFGIFQNVKILYNVQQGVGSKGFYCEPFDYAAFMSQMTGLTAARTTTGPLRDSSFCRDKIAVHGPRDCFREIVADGEGLHICITQPAARGTEHCDCHIDEHQQGQVCFDGWCVP